MSRRRALWVSTSTETRGGVASYVRTMQATPLWDKWDIRHVSTHRNGSVATRIVAFLAGSVSFVRELLVRRPAVVHLHTASYGSFGRKSLLAWVSRCAGVPVVLHIHGAAFHEFYRSAPRLLQWYIRATLHGVASVIALGDIWRGLIREIAPRARITVVPNAVKPGVAVAQPGPGEAVHVLFLGEVEERKGTFLLLDAWRRLGDVVPPPGADLVIAGGGAVEAAREMAREFDIAGKVRVTGWVPPDQVQSLLRCSHVLVLPSTFEGQPMAVLEAMALGLCVVASNVGGVPDLMDDESGVLVPAEDADALVAALRSVLTDAERRSRLGARALARVRERFDVDLTWREIDALYTDITT